MARKNKPLSPIYSLSNALNKSLKLPWLIVALFIALIALFLTRQSLTGRANDPEGNTAGSPEQYLPLIINSGPFNPTSDTTLGAGNYAFTEVNIPEGVTVTFTSDVTINVHGDTNIAGMLSGDCHSLEIRGVGAFMLDGAIDNTCSFPPEDAPGIKIVADGLVTIGLTPSNDEAINSDGGILLTDTASENDSLEPLCEEEACPLLLVASTSNAAAGAGGAINKPIRAGAGKDVQITLDGPLNVAANLTAEDGKDAATLNVPGTCDASNLIGGSGGGIFLSARGNTLTVAGGVTLQAGDGGKGGSCIAPSGCPATATAGKGGRGGGIYFGGQNVDFGVGVTLIRGSGGPGGDATATGDDGDAPCADGCDATATGGLGGQTGGIGYIITLPGGIVGAPSEAGGNGGTGGVATASGGDGQDCDQCPGGKGGDGGMATSVGGKGGDGASGNIWPMAAGSHLKGNGGLATATGGMGGDGADCCGPDKFGPHLPGGDGGKGGDATATGGLIGDKGKNGNGTRGGTDGKGGDGGNGGDGDPPGSGGAKGIGTGDPTDIPDGVDGLPGLPCPELMIWFIYHSSIPDGTIPPGTVITLSTYITTDIGTDPTGNVPLLFMSPGDLGYPPNYSKLDNMLQVVGGLRYDLLPILDGFPVIGADVSLNHTCPNPGCIQVLGFSGGDVVGAAQNQLMWIGGPPIHEQIHLPPPPPGMLYDGFAIVLSQPTAFFEFDHWWIIIIDP